MYQLDNIKNLPPLEHLRSFVIFVESPNISKAAEEAQISQPLMSLHLKLLEEHLQVTLFEFVGKKKVLSETGRTFYSLVREHLERMSTDLQSLMNTKSQHKKLRIGARKEILDSLIADLDFDGSLFFKAITSQEIEISLQKREIEIGISQKMIDSNSLVRKKLWSDRFVLFWNRNLPITKSRIPSEVFQQLSRYRCFHYGETSPLNKIALEYKLNLNHRSEFADWKILVSLCEKNEGWGIAPSGFLNFESAHLKTLELPPVYTEKTDFYIYYQKDLAKLVWFQSFLNQILALKRDHKPS